MSKLFENVPLDELSGAAGRLVSRKTLSIIAKRLRAALGITVGGMNAMAAGESLHFTRPFSVAEPQPWRVRSVGRNAFTVDEGAVFVSGSDLPLLVGADDPIVGAGVLALIALIAPRFRRIGHEDPVSSDYWEENYIYPGCELADVESVHFGFLPSGWQADTPADVNLRGGTASPGVFARPLAHCSAGGIVEQIAEPRPIRFILAGANCG